jgi:predicted Zn-dependent protease
MLVNEKETRSICEQVLGRLKVDDAVVALGSSIHGNQRFAKGSFTTNGRIEEVNISLTIWKNKRKGASSATELTKDALDQLAAEAVRLAELSPIDEEYVPTLSQQKYRAVPGIFAESSLKPSLEKRAKALHEVFDLADKEHVVAAGLVETEASGSGSLSQNGNFEYERRSSGTMSMTARLPDGSSSGYFLRNTIDPDKLDITRIAREAIWRATTGRGAQVIPPGVYPVILEPQAVVDILDVLSWVLDARGADEGRTAMSTSEGKTKLGQDIFDKRLSFYSDPWHSEVPASQATREGLPAEKLYLVRDGTLENLVYSRYWAKEKGRRATPGPVNTILESSGATHSVEEMIANSERALLVTRFWYIRMVDPRTVLLTGLTRDGVWLIEKGKIKHPVRNFRFNQSVMQMLASGNVDQVSKPERVVPSPRGDGPAGYFPALKLRAFNFTSASDAV